ncbi:hypothetical protein B484DRAFT_426834 [Ochromonadaceae sp. CCMP2298]|nr:hypothetical protein B484DRAFT_426834 [Ochromonadaceae sp. CCMP2298]
MESHGSTSDALDSKLASSGPSVSPLEIGDLAATQTMRSQSQSRSQSRTRGSIAGVQKTDPSTSGAATRRRMDRDLNEQVLALQKALAGSEAKLADHIKARKKLTTELETKSREGTFYSRKCQTLQGEVQSLKHSVEQSLTMHSASARQAGARLRSVDAIAHYRVCDELTQAQEALHRTEGERSAAAEGEAQSLLRVGVLEAALDLRCQEVGLAGQASLLLRIAQTQGENETLRSDVGLKGAHIAKLEEAAEVAAVDMADLRARLDSLQGRLTLAQQESHRLHNSDLLELLRAAEGERDRLANFVQRDLQTSSRLSRQVGELEGQLQTARDRLGGADGLRAELEAHLRGETEAKEKWEGQCRAGGEELHALKHAARLAEDERRSLSVQVSRKSAEAEQLNALQTDLFAQAASREHELFRVTGELSQVQSSLNRLECSAPSVAAENARLQAGLATTTEEVQTLRENLASLGPRLSKLEPEVITLREERVRWTLEREARQREVDRLAPLGRTLDDIGRELAHITGLSDAAAATAVSLRVGQAGFGGVENVGDLNAGDVNGPSALDAFTPSLSQRHSLWVGLPALRSLSPPLYDCIRRMASDLHAQETLAHSLQRKADTADLDLRRHSAHHDAQWRQLSAQGENATATVQRLSTLLRAAEGELGTLRLTRVALQQVRAVLSSSPSSFAGLYVQDLVAAVGTAADISHAAATASPTPHTDRAQALSPGSAGRGAGAGAGAGESKGDGRGRGSGESAFPTTKDEVEAQLSKVPDTSLPDLVGRALMHNAAAVIERGEYARRLSLCDKKCADLGAEVSQLATENRTLGGELEEARRELVQGFEQVEGATALAERQNALVLTLEAKVGRGAKGLRIGR